MRNRLSLRARLLGAVGAITLVALVLADVAVYASLHTYLFDQVDNQLRASTGALVTTLAHRGGPGIGAANPGPPGAPPAAGAPPATLNFCQIGRQSAPGMFVEVRTPADAVESVDGSAAECPAFQAGGPSYEPVLPGAITGFTTGAADANQPSVSFTATSTTPGGGPFRVLATELAGGQELVVGERIADLNSTLGQLVLVELLVSTATLLAAVLLGLWLVRVGLRPLRDVERTADAIAAGEFIARVPNANTKTEVGHVATAFNVMLERIETAFSELSTSENRLRRFVGDASHELRTPIAAVLAYAQLSRHAAAREPGELERVMTGIERESSRMARLVDDLLTLARLDEGAVLHPERVELVGLAAEAVETARTVGPDWPVTFAATDALEVLGDRSSLRQAVDNLMANVRAHTPPGTSVTLSVSREAERAVLSVADGGPGVSEGQSALVFERFFRADPSRFRGETGGAGLGLAIVASIVAAHGGEVSAGPNPGGGACFSISLPLAPPE